jgi:2-oxoglutarate ferredoxin oxidoreductase subunit delta
MRICSLDKEKGTCDQCKGTGNCPTCGGDGRNPRCKHFKCPTCQGSGKCPFHLEEKAIVTVDKERCKGCGLCVACCRKRVLRMSQKQETNKKGYNFVRIRSAKKCTGCANCAIICPETIIEISKR